MEDEAIDTFTSFTGESAAVARRYLAVTDNNAQQAIQLFFDSPDLASGLDQTSQANSSSNTRPQQGTTNRHSEDNEGVIHIDSDDDAGMDIDETDEHERVTAISRAADTDEDEAIARRMQEELYASGDGDGVRAPIARTTETLVGGDGDWQSDDMSSAVLEQMRARQQRQASRIGVFNQRAPSIWEESDPDVRRRGLASATGGASETSAKAARLAELFRPPFELMCRKPWDDAREQGKEEGKWLLVNVQDPSIFDCQQLNRDIWKHEGIKEVVKENFLFMQYSNDDPRGSQYIQYYFPLKDSPAAYPHIAIVDPRTGEQVKVWSGPPVPKPADFLMQLIEFLDRYSLDVTKKNPVAKRKVEKPKELDIDRLTEEEMLDLALQNSLAGDNGPGPKDHDPDDLTKSFTDAGKGKGKEVEGESTNGQPEAEAASTPFSQISQNNPHIEPNAGPSVTRIQFRHSNGRVIRRFNIHETVRRIYEWLKAEPLEGKEGVEFDLKSMGKDLIDHLDETIQDAGLGNGTVMVEYLED
ncbi:hypothetical protein F5884DRAFT_772050 [Xylogone sp. PMI_703]|nr:hypothetical protein F5884DRAFT_772050 [Xylogone sp. PMI_703]